MGRSSAVLGLVVAMLAAARPGLAQLVDPRVVPRGKAATAFVEVEAPRGSGSGSAFCIHESGLFITNAHVVEPASRSADARVWLVIDIGRPSQRAVEAQVFRADPRVDLALLKVSPLSPIRLGVNPAVDPALPKLAAIPPLSPVEFGSDPTLEAAEITAFGFPFGRAAAVARNSYPDISVNRSRITSLRKEAGRLKVIQFDGKINPGNSGGPVLDEDGRLVGVAWATLRGAGTNFAIPVGVVADFLARPDLVFDPPQVTHYARLRPATWTVTVRPPTPLVALPDDLSVAITITGDGDHDERTVRAVPVGKGTGEFRATVTPIDREPGRRVEVDAVFGPRSVRAEVDDFDLTVAGRTYRASGLRQVVVAGDSRLIDVAGGSIAGRIAGLPKVGASVDGVAETLDLGLATTFRLRALEPPPAARWIEARVEARRGDEVLVGVVKRLEILGSPGRTRPDPPNIRTSRTIVTPDRVAVVRTPPAAPTDAGRADLGLIKFGGKLDATESPRGAGRSIRPPSAEMGEVGAAAPGPPLVRPVGGTITGVVAGGGGRYLLLTLKDARKLAVFDVNSADVVGTIPLPSRDVMVAAGARKFVIASPEERMIQRWDLATLTREAGPARLPIEGELKGIGLGPDSDGPILAAWAPPTPLTPVATPPALLYSFLGLDSLKVLRVETFDPGRRGGFAQLSESAGSFRLSPFSIDGAAIRALSGGGAFGIFNPTTNDLLTVRVRDGSVAVGWSHGVFGDLAPGYDGLTFFTESAGRRDWSGQSIGTPVPRNPQDLGEFREPVLPTTDPALFLAVTLPGFRRHRSGPEAARPASATLRVAADETPLVRFGGIDDLFDRPSYQPRPPGGLGLSQRVHCVPGAGLLVTIPTTDDRLVLRRLDVSRAIGRLGGDYLIVTSPANLRARPGRTLEHRVVAVSKKGGVRFALADGPEGFRVAPDGSVSYPVPIATARGEIKAVVVVNDASGLERFHTLIVRTD